MKKAFGFIFVSAGILVYATILLVGIPYLQLSKATPEDALKPYSELELKGRNIYVKNGCVYCHSQQPREKNSGPDGLRNWGRPSTPSDYAYDYPHQLGTMRTGPDLLNIGVRQPSEDWHLVHLYQPRAVLPNSVMPSYPYMFEIKNEAEDGDKVVNLPPQYAPQGKVVVAGEEALALVAYLKSLKRSYPTKKLRIFEKEAVSE